MRRILKRVFLPVAFVRLHGRSQGEARKPEERAHAQCVQHLRLLKVDVAKQEAAYWFFFDKETRCTDALVPGESASGELSYAEKPCPK